MKGSKFLKKLVKLEDKNMTKFFRLKNFKKKYNLKKVTQNFTKLRLSIFKSNNHIYGQIINDKINQTLVSSSTLNPYLVKTRKYFHLPLEKISFMAGQILGKKLIFMGVKNVVFDRKNNIFHGRIKNYILGIRSTGIQV